jgi:copper(I)-binding protein
MEPKLNVKHWRALVASAVVLLVAVVGLSACGGDDDGAGTDATAPPATSKIEIADAWARETPNDVSAVYMVIKNSGAADRLVSAASSKSPNVQIHETVTEGSSMRMQEVEGGIEVPANAEVALAPGGYHIMLMNLAEPVKAGETLDIELTFEKAGVMNLDVPVKSGGGMMQHSAESGGMDGMASEATHSEGMNAN